MNGKKANYMKIKTGEYPLITRLLSFTLAFSIILISVLVPAVMPVPVYASASVGTFKAFLIGMSAMMGVGNVDPSSISYMNNNTVLSAPIEDFVGDNPIYTAQDINQALSGNEGVARWTAGFSNNAAQVKVAQQYVTSAGGDSSGLNNLGGSSAGENLISSARYGYNNYKTNGNFDLKPSIGGQTMTDAIDATAVMTAMSNYAYNFDQYMQYANNANLTQEERDELWDQGLVFADQNQIEDYLQNRNKTIVNGSKLDISNNAVSNLYNNGGVCSYHLVTSSSEYDTVYIYSEQIVAVSYLDNNGNYVWNRINISNSRADEKYYRTNSSNPSIISSYIPANQNKGAIQNDTYVSANGFYYVGNLANYNAYINGLRNGTAEKPKKYSPSLVGNNGQLSGTTATDPVTNQNVYNINVSPNNNYVTFNYGIPSDENISTFQNSIQTGIEQGFTQEELGAIFLNFANSFRSEVTIPQPTQEPMPTFVPPQPTGVPVTPIPPEDEEELPKAMAPAGLITKFPFSIPWDVVYAIKHFGTDDRNAPVLDADIDLGPAGVHHVHIDFSDYDDVAVLLRSLQLLVFIVLLAKATKHLMWS